MVLKADQLRVKALLTETITLLCKNGLNYRSEFAIEALIGITLDKDDVFLISIKEKIDGGMGILDAGDDPARGLKRDFDIDISGVDEANASINDADELTVPTSPESETNTSIQLFRAAPYLKKRRRTVADNTNIYRKVAGDSNESDGTSAVKQDSSHENIHIKEEPDIVMIKDEENNETYDNNAFTSADAMSNMNFEASFASPSTSNYDSTLFNEMDQRSQPYVHETLNQAPHESSSQYRSEQSRSLQTTSDKSAYVTSVYGDTASARAQSSDGSGLLKCHLCDRSFKCPQNLNDHVNGKHLNICSFKCFACGKAFRWRSVLSSHRRKCSAAQLRTYTGGAPSSDAIPVQFAQMADNSLQFSETPAATSSADIV